MPVLNGRSYTFEEHFKGYGYHEFYPGTTSRIFPDLIFADWLAEVETQKAGIASVYGVAPGAAGRVLRSDGSNWTAAVLGWTDINAATLPAYATRWPTWAEITVGKPATFAPSAHTHTMADITDFNSTHDHNTLYYTKTELGASGGGIIHWTRLTNLPTTVQGYGIQGGNFTSNVSMPATIRFYLDGGNHTYFTEVSDNVLQFVAGGVEGLRITPTGFVAAGGNFTARPTVNGVNVVIATDDPGDTHTHDSRYYTETESDARFAPISHDHNTLYYTKAELNTSAGAGQVHWDRLTGKPATFSPSTHTHDDRYFTETESNELFATVGHSHALTAATITGVLPTTKGGTGLAAVSPFVGANRLLYSTSATALATIAPYATANNGFLRQNASGVPAFARISWGDIDNKVLTHDITDHAIADPGVLVSNGTTWSVRALTITDLPHSHDDRYFTETEINERFNTQSITLSQIYGGFTANSLIYASSDLALGQLLPHATATQHVLASSSSGISWVPMPASSVTSVFGRTGAVVAAANDYSYAQLSDKPTLPDPGDIGFVVATGNAGAFTYRNPTTNDIDQIASTAKIGVSLLGAGTPSGSNFLRGDGVWAMPNPTTSVDLTGITGGFKGDMISVSQDGGPMKTVPAHSGTDRRFLSQYGNGIGDAFDPEWFALPAPPVTSVFGRQGAVVSAAGDYNFSQISAAGGTWTNAGWTRYTDVFNGYMLRILTASAAWGIGAATGADTNLYFGFSTTQAANGTGTISYPAYLSTGGQLVLSAGLTATAGAFSSTLSVGGASTLTGAVTSGGSFITSASQHQFNTPHGYIQIGPMNTGTAHIYTDRPSFYFNAPIYVNGTLVSMTGHSHNFADIGAKPAWSNWTTYSPADTTGFTGAYLGWKHYGGGHIIFDASNSTAPNGTAISNTDPAIDWEPTYPTLMGWNGSSTYGVRVARAKLAENAGALGTLVLAIDGQTPAANSVIRSSSSGYTYLGYINSNTGRSENPSDLEQVIVTNSSDNFYRRASISFLTGKVQANASGAWAIQASEAVSNTITRDDGGVIGPNTYAYKTAWRFARMTEDAGNPPGDVYWGTLLTMQPWDQHNASYPTHQMAWRGPALSMRYSTSASAWSAWKQVMLNGETITPVDVVTTGVVHTYVLRGVSGTNLYFQNNAATNLMYLEETGRAYIQYGATIGAVNNGGATINGDVRINAGKLLCGGSASAYEAGDMSVSRNSAPTTGVIYFGNAQNKYLYWDNTQFNFVGGNVLGPNFVLASDLRLKQDLHVISDALDRLDMIAGYTYALRSEPSVRRSGVVAQEVQTVLPEVVMQNGEYLGVAYDGLVPLLIEGIKELRREVRDLKARMH